MTQSVEDGLKKNAGLGPEFDLLRLGLALSIVFIHCFVLSNGSTEVLGNNVPSGVPLEVQQHIEPVISPVSG